MQPHSNQGKFCKKHKYSWLTTPIECINILVSSQRSKPETTKKGCIYHCGPWHLGDPGVGHCHVDDQKEDCENPVKYSYKHHPAEGRIQKVFCSSNQGPHQKPQYLQKLWRRKETVTVLDVVHLFQVKEQHHCHSHNYLMTWDATLGEY